MVLGMGGLPCIAWSKVGLKKGSFIVWLQERRQLAAEGVDLEDGFVFENVQEFPSETKMRDELQDSHHIIILKFQPQDLPGFHNCLVMSVVYVCVVTEQ